MEPGPSWEIHSSATLLNLISSLSTAGALHIQHKMKDEGYTKYKGALRFLKFLILYVQVHLFFWKTHLDLNLNSMLISFLLLVHKFTEV